jgi:hypothetical protein
MPRQTRPLEGTFWRFLVIDDESAPRWIVRDIDSRLSYRERRAVDEWINSALPFHIMRDHPWQSSVIGGGLVGGIRGALPRIAEKILTRGSIGHYGADQEFLAQILYPLVKDHALFHDSFASHYEASVRPFPTPYENLRFVGERINPDGSCWIEDREALASAIGAVDK